jgi:hypothetical protein
MGEEHDEPVTTPTSIAFRSGANLVGEVSTLKPRLQGAQESRRVSAVDKPVVV